MTANIPASVPPDSLAAGDIDGDSKAELVFGAGPGGSPRVRIANGAKLLTVGPVLDDPAAGVQLANFFAGGPTPRGGVRVAVKDVDADSKADLVTGSGEGEQFEQRSDSALSLLKDQRPAKESSRRGPVIPGGESAVNECELIGLRSVSGRAITPPQNLRFYLSRLDLRAVRRVGTSARTPTWTVFRALNYSVCDCA